MIDKRTCFVVWSLLYLMSVDGFPIYGELSVNVSVTKNTWENAKAECQKGGLRLTNYLTVESLGHINTNQDYWIGENEENGKCPMLSNKSPTTRNCSEVHYFLCSPKEIADMNHVIMTAVGVFTIINMILVTICVLRRLCKKQARLLKDEKPKATSKKDKKEQKKKDKRQKEESKVSDDTKQDAPAAAGDAEAPKQAGDDAQTVQTTAVVEIGATGIEAIGTADVDTTSTTPAVAAAAAASATRDAEASKEEKLPDPPEFILNDTTSTATTTPAADSTTSSVAVVTSTATAISTTTGTGVADTGIVSSSITTPGTNVDAPKEGDMKDPSCQEEGKADPAKAVVTTDEDKPSLMAEMEALLQEQSTESKQGETTPIEPPLPPPPEEVIKSETTTET